MSTQSLTYLRLRLTVQPAEASPGPGKRPRLSATQLRRVLGKALIDLFCPFGEPRCQMAGGCAQKRQCPYGVLFAASTGRRPPFALYLLPADPNSVRQQVDVTLYGPSWQLFPWMLSGLARALEVGIGKQRHPWAIHQVTQVGTTLQRLCGDDLRRLPATVQPDLLVLPSTSWDQASVQKQVPGTSRPAQTRLEEQVEKQVPGTSRPAQTRLEKQVPGTSRPAQTRLEKQVPGTSLDALEKQVPGTTEVHLLSPTRLLHDGRLLFGDAPVPFRILIARTLDRLRDLYGDDACQLLRPSMRADLESSAGEVTIIEAQTRWVEQKDYSARSRSELLLGGKIGRLVYGRGAERFLPILKLGEILQVGKNVTAGCGRMAVVP